MRPFAPCLSELLLILSPTHQIIGANHRYCSLLLGSVVFYGVCIVDPLLHLRRGRSWREMRIEGVKVISYNCEVIDRHRETESA